MADLSRMTPLLSGEVTWKGVMEADAAAAADPTPTPGPKRLGPRSPPTLPPPAPPALAVAAAAAAAGVMVPSGPSKGRGGL